MKQILLFLIVFFLVNFLIVEGAFAGYRPIKVIKKVGRFTNDLAVDPVANRVYAANIESNDLAVIDGSRDKVIDRIRISGSEAVTNVVTDPARNRLYVASQYSESNTISALDPDTKEILAMIDIPFSSPELSPRELVVYRLDVNPNTNKIYFVTFLGELGVINELTNEIKIIPIQDRLDGLKVNSNTNKVYAGSEMSLYVINSETDTVTKTVEIESSGFYGTSIDIDPVRNKIYVLIFAEKRRENFGTINIVDGASDELLDSDSISVQSATIFAVDPGDNVLYVPKSFDIKGAHPFVVIVDLNSNRVIKKLINIFKSLDVHSTQEPDVIVVNPNTHKAYILAGEVGLVVVGKK